MSTGVSPPGNGGQHQTAAKQNEDELRKLLRTRLHALTRREPLDPTYKHYLLGSAREGIRPPRSLGGGNKLYKSLGSGLRDTVQAYLDAGGDEAAQSRKRGFLRPSLEEGPMRAAFTLRETKKHEQEALVAPLLQAERGKKRRLDEMALGLQEREHRLKTKTQRTKLASAARDKIITAERNAERNATAAAIAAAATVAATATATATTTAATTPESKAAVVTQTESKKQTIVDHVDKVQEELKLQKEREELRKKEEKERLLERERARERERQRQLALQRHEEDERRRIETERAEAERDRRMSETPQQALHRLFEPIFRHLWDMEFAILHGTNPFRIVIDAQNCAAMGVPDYCDVIKTPMNLTYIRDKVDGAEYTSFQEFFDDVELMLNNALLYNSDPNNEFHLAAKEMKKKYKKQAKKVMQDLQKLQQAKVPVMWDDDED